jgi:hypothetical protein
MSGSSTDMSLRRLLHLAIWALGTSLLAARASAAPPDLSGTWWIKDRTQTAAIDHSTLPFQPAAAREYARERAAAVRGEHVPLGQHSCMPEGVPRLMLARYPIQVLQRAELVTILHERMHMVRFLFLDRPHRVDTEPTYNGESVARWAGDALQVETIAFLPGTALDGTGIPHSGALRVRESFTLRDAGRVLRDEVTIEDPETFTRPWTFAIDYERRSDVRLMEDVCTFGPPQRDRSAPTARSLP